MLAIFCNHLEIYLPRSQNILFTSIYTLSRKRSWNKRAQWAAAAIVFLLQGILLGSKHFHSLPFTKNRWSTCMVQLFLFSQARIKLGRISLFHCNNASLLLRCWWFLSTAHVARSVISKAQALLLWNKHPTWMCVKRVKRSTFHPDSQKVKVELNGNSVIQQDLTVFEVHKLSQKLSGLDPKKDLHWKKGKSLKRRLVFKRRIA